MPPAPSNKVARNSVYGWTSSTKKRSVSPTSASAQSSSHHHHHHARKPVAASVTTQPAMPTASAAASSSKRGEETLYFEEDYREEITRYMTEMDVSVVDGMPAHHNLRVMQAARSTADRQNATVASADLMDMQPELQWFMRPYLIDFLVEVHQQFRLRPEVLYLAMNIVDRYVSKRVVYKKHYQLVGCAALWIAAKFEDGKDKVPLVRELAEMCCKAYDESAFIQMEGHVLSTIGWVTGHPSAEAWLRMHTTGAYAEDGKVGNVARFLMEITLFHREFVGIQSSLIAQGALMLARFICGKPRRAVGRYENVAVRIALAIDKHFAEKLDAVSEIVIRKYAPTYYGRASTVVREWYLSGRRFHYNPEVPHTPVTASGGLAPSNSWSSKRNSWISPSPSAGSMSCASSDAGDESPLTPITPIHGHHVDPFTTMVSASKENIAPVYAATSAVAMQVKDSNVLSGVKQQQTVYAARPPLHALPTVGDLSIPNGRNMRRLSN